MTAQDLISSALRLIGVQASGESLGANEATDGLSSLNDMLDSWSTNNLLIPNKVKEVFSLTPSKQAYTMGTSVSPDWNTARPMWIENVYVQQGAGSNTLDLPVQIYTKDQWASIPTKQTQTVYPTYCYPEGTYPNETLNFWPIPSTSESVVIYSAKALAHLGLSTTISLPPGYNRALRYCLAVELAPEFGATIPEAVAAHAAASIADIKRVNHRPKFLIVDSALRGQKPGFDWRTGDPT